MKSRVPIAIGLLLLGGWLCVGFLGWPISRVLASKLGAKLVSMGDGKFSDPVVFLHGRIWEAAALVTAGAILLAIVWLAFRLAGRRFRGAGRWIVPSITGFVGLNLWIAFAGTTCLFWLLLWSGKGNTHNLTQFRIKLLLMPEHSEPSKVVLAGSSQMLAQVNAKQLNALLSPNAFATGLQFPGSRAFDFCLLSDDLEGARVETIVCYVSELNFFQVGTGPGIATFFGFDDLPLYRRIGGRYGWYPQDLGYGLLGNALPLFRLRGPLSERLYGAHFTNLQQDRRNVALTADMEKRADEAVATYREGEESAFQFAAFREFLERNKREGRKVMICCGQLNPVLAAKLNPQFRPRMIETLRRYAGEFSNVTLLEPDTLPVQTPSDYEDLTHVNKEAQARFTEALARLLMQQRQPQDAVAKRVIPGVGR